MGAQGMPEAEQLTLMKVMEMVAKPGRSLDGATDPEFIKKVNSLVEAGAASLKAHKVYDAIESLAEAVELAPGFWRGHFLLGIARVTNMNEPTSR